MDKRKTSLVLLIALMAFLFSCSTTVEDTPASGEVTSEMQVETDYLETLPDTNFNGAEFNIIGVDYATRRNFSNDEERGEIVNDSLAKRDLIIEELYNIVLNCTPIESAAKVTEIVRNTISAGDADYNLIISDIASSLSVLMRSGMLHDLLSLPYLNLSADWWSVGMYENTSYHGKQYITLGDISPMKYYAPYCLAYNRVLADDNNVGDLYSEVLNGTWTVDRFGELIRDINRDLDGNSVLNVDDFYGYAYIASEITACAHYTGAGEKLSKITGSGDIEVTIDSEHSISVMEKLRDILSVCPGFTHDETIKMFKESRALFYGNSYSNIIANFRDMEDDFSVIPTPKLDSKQEKYYSYINTWCLGGVGVPLIVIDEELTGLISEALCYVSYTEVRPALYEKVMKVKVARDDANAQILDILFDNTYIDLNGIYNFGGSLNLVADVIWGKKDFSSSFASINEKIITEIDQFQIMTTN